MIDRLFVRKFKGCLVCEIFFVKKNYFTKNISQTYVENQCLSFIKLVRQPIALLRSQEPGRD